MILLNILAHRLDELLHTVLEVGVNVVHHATNRVVVQNQATTTSFFEDVEYLFTVAESIKEGRRSTEVLTQAAEEENVRVDTLQLVHNRTDYLYAVAHFYPHSLLNTHTQGMAVLHRTEVVQTIGQGQRLWVSHAFADLLYATVNVTQHGVNLLNDFALKANTEVKHTMCRGVLRTDVDNVVVSTKNLVLYLINRTVLLQLIFVSNISQRLVSHVLRVEGVVLLRVVVLTEGIANPVLAHKQTAHVGVVGKDNAVVVVHLTFVNVGNVP